MTGTIDAVVVGAGVVGLAVARALALTGLEVVVLEKNRGIGEETSSRNSEVIHAGIYYAPGSMKARLCVAGNRALYAYCTSKGVPYARCGKLIVATHAAQRAKLEGIATTAAANGVDLERLSPSDVARLEPALSADAGLWSASTGIVDSHALMLALRGDVEQAGGAVAVLTRCVSGRRENGVWRVTCATEDGPFELHARALVNAAGLHASAVALALGAPSGAVPAPLYAKGNYFALGAKSPFTHLVYPLPEDGGLGVHATLDLSGRVRFGPDVEWLPRGVTPDAFDYHVDANRAAAFYSAIRTYWPDLPDGALTPAYAGVRPKLAAPGEAAADFAIRRHDEATAARAVHLFGIESPGLTASLAIGAYVADLLTQPG